MASAFSYGFSGSEDRCEKMFKMVVPTYESAEERKHRQDHQRHQHHHRTLARLAVSMGIVSVGGMPMRVHLRCPVIAEERHVQQAEHVERCNKGGNHTDCPVHEAGLVSLPKNFVLTPEAGQRRDSSNC